MAWHRWDAPSLSLPYEKTYAMSALEVEVLDSAARYMTKQGQVGTARYTPPREAPEAQAPRKRPVKRASMSRTKSHRAPA